MLYIKFGRVGHISDKQKTISHYCSAMLQYKSNANHNYYDIEVPQKTCNRLLATFDLEKSCSINEFCLFCYSQ